MRAERWQEIDRLFDAVLERAPVERAAFLAACTDDDELRREVESLLAASERAEKFIETPAMEVAAKVAATRETGAEDFTALGRGIGPYRVLSLLGAGGMGEVYLAEDTRLGRRVALKLLPAEFTHDAGRVRRFEREARAASALNHPNIVTIYEMGQSDGAYFIATELVEGRTLRRFMSHARAQTKESLNIIAQVADALSAAHAAGIVHRDIKPENIMLRPDGYVKVLDFGLAKLTELRNAECGLRIEEPELSSNPQSAIRIPQLTDTGAVMGTVAYMSPEQALGQEVDHRTDIFSLGVVLYEMMAGKHPFKGPTAAATFDALLNRDPLPPATSNPDVSPELERIIGRALEKDRELRYQTASDLRAELKRWQRTSESSPTVSARTDARTAQHRRLVSRARGVTIGLALAALLVVVSVSVSSWLAESNIFGRRETAPILAAPFRSEKFSSSGKVFHAALSPDGTLVAYIDESGGRYSVWLRRLETADNVQLVPPSEVFYGGLVFAHDGRSIFFTRRPQGDDLTGAAIYRVPVFGGIPEKILEHTQSWISLSPDDRQISFVRCERRSDDYCSLLTADADGKNERKILTRPEPIRISDNQFSPDGKSIAFADGQSWSGGSDFRLRRVDLASGAESQISPTTFFDIKSLKWLPGDDELLVTAQESSAAGWKIWRVSAATGEAEPLTKDAGNYLTISFDKGASKMVATQFGNDFHLYFSAEGVTRMLAPADETTFAPGGKIIYAAPDGDIWAINRDGGEQRQLTNDASKDFAPRVSPDGRFIFFTSNRSGANQIWRMNADGSNQTQLTKIEGGYPRFVTPDGKWVYYENGLRQRLWKVAAGGGEGMQVLDRKFSSPAFTPDGQMLAYVSTDEGMKIAVLSLADNQLLKVYTPAHEKSWPHRLAWSADNRTLHYVTRRDAKNSLWQQALNEDRPRLVADLGDKGIQDFAVAPDGGGFAYVRGEWLHNAVLIHGLK